MASVPIEGRVLPRKNILFFLNRYYLIVITPIWRKKLRKLTLL